MWTLSERIPTLREIEKNPRREIERRKRTITGKTETDHIPAEIAKGNTREITTPDTAETVTKQKTPRGGRRATVTQILPRSRLLTGKPTGTFGTFNIF